MKAIALLAIAAGASMSCGPMGGTGHAPGQARTPGEAVYNNNCAMCHGGDGDLKMSGAKDLTRSTLSREETLAIITHGKGGMLGFGNVLTPEQLGQVTDHVLTLRAAK